VPEARSEEALRRLADAGIERAAVIGALSKSEGDTRIRVRS
jgi:hypothetical protein